MLVVLKERRIRLMCGAALIKSMLFQLRLNCSARSPGCVGPQEILQIYIMPHNYRILYTTKKSVTLDNSSLVCCVEYLRRGVTPRLAKWSVSGGAPTSALHVS
jgi:hypothetical protein